MKNIKLNQILNWIYNHFLKIGKKNVPKYIVRKIIKEKLGCNVKGIKDCSKGADQIVKIVTTNKGKFVVKFPKSKEMADRQIFAHNKFEKKIPLANVLYSNKEYIIETFVKGVELSKIKRKNSLKKAFVQLGEIMSKIHLVKLKGFGFIENNEGKYDSMKEFIDKYWLRNRLGDLLKYKTVTKEEMLLIKEYLKQNEPLLKTKDSYLLHFDFIDDNIVIKDDVVSGILDFADIISGPREFDFSKLYIAHYHDGVFNFILKGYKHKIDMDKIEYYAALTLMRLLPYYEMAKPEQYKKRLQLMWKIINKNLKINSKK